MFSSDNFTMWKYILSKRIRLPVNIIVKKTWLMKQWNKFTNDKLWQLHREDIYSVLFIKEAKQDKIERQKFIYVTYFSECWSSLTCNILLISNSERVRMILVTGAWSRIALMFFKNFKLISLHVFHILFQG